MQDATFPHQQRIRDFAEKVREQLSDLPADELDDILDGLVADLTEQAFDAGDELTLGDPAAYARELRDAAGLPERQDAKRDWLRGTRDAVVNGARMIPSAIRRNPLGAAVLDFFVDLRPVWWIIRGAAFAAFLHLITIPNQVIPAPYEWSASYFWVNAGAILLSIQWGRGRWVPKRFLRILRTAMSVAAVLAIAPMLSSFAASPYFECEEILPADGLLLDGTQIGNIFPYNEKGELLRDVQLYTDKGTPIRLYGGRSDSYAMGWESPNTESHYLLPFYDVHEKAFWNVYPLQNALKKEASEEPDRLSARDSVPPFVRAPGLVEGQATPAPSDDASPEPSESTEKKNENEKEKDHAEKQDAATPEPSKGTQP